MEDSFLKVVRKKLRATTQILKEVPSKFTKQNAIRLAKTKRVKLAATIGICAYGLITFWPTPLPYNVQVSAQKKMAVAVPDTYFFGIKSNDKCIDEYKIKNGETLSGILANHGIEGEQTEKLLSACSEKFDLRGIRPTQLLAFVHDNEAHKPSTIIYQPNIFSYYTIDLEDSIVVKEVKKEVKLVQKEASGVIESNLWNAMKTSGASDELADYLGDVLAWTVDFYHLYKGDEFKILYTEKQIEGKPVGVESIEAAYYKQLDVPSYVFKYHNEKYKDEYYDEKGRPARRAFLKAPVKFSRISSRYSRRRFHPVLKRNKSHLGTDYAAPRGTPVYATANGVVSKAGRTRGNGNYVKVKHNKTYSTQYLHFSRIAKGIRPGVKVKQGQTIGYVGSTGYATGPHVCYRFWKNGRQVDPFRQKLPAPPPMEKADLPNYLTYMDSLKVLLDQVKVVKPAVQGEEVIMAAKKP